MKKIAVIYHSGYGHTQHFARFVHEGVASVSGTKADLLTIEEAGKNLEGLAQYDAFVFGSPTYMGGVSGPFKSFMDSTSSIWLKQSLKKKFAAGFTVSGSPSGDKQTTLISMAVFAAQHGMIWVGNPIMPEVYSGVPAEQAANRLGSFLGAMAQASQDAPDKAFVAGDLKTAKVFGENFAKTVVEI